MFDLCKNQLPGLSIIGTLVENVLRRALCHNARTSQDMKYYTSDIAYHKKRNSNYWKGPGTVGQDGQHVFVKHLHILECILVNYNC